MRNEINTFLCKIFQVSFIFPGPLRPPSGPPWTPGRRPRSRGQGEEEEEAILRPRRRLPRREAGRDARAMTNQDLRKTTSGYPHTFKNSFIFLLSSLFSGIVYFHM